MSDQATFDLFTEPGDRHRRVQDCEVGFHHSDPVDTELVSALALVKKSGDKKKRLLKALVDAGWYGLTDFDSVRVTGLQMSSINSCRNSLKRREWVMDSTRRRPSPVSGLPTIVWCATSAGRRQVK